MEAIQNNFTIFRPLHPRMQLLLNRKISHRTKGTPQNFAQSERLHPARIEQNLIKLF
ncbi:hypothetical protein HYT05_01875 [Candidatus Kaiserbacteria bacterium]|nr:hypothetical protein [Candidatus Kaiserbacteria bacterium]